MQGTAFKDESSWQDIAGYARARLVNGQIAVSGTTADLESMSPADRSSTYSQVTNCLERGIAAIEALGGRKDLILRSRMYLTPDADPLEASRAHAEHLGEVSPANTTLYVHSLIGPGLLVEVELDSFVDDGSPQ